MRALCKYKLIYINFTIAIYVGLLLNVPTLWRANNEKLLFDISDVFAVGIAMIAITFFLLNISIFIGRYIYKLIAVFVLLLSVVASYYMTIHKVVIGYGTIVSTLTLDIDLSKEMISFNGMLWFLLLGGFPALLIIISKIEGCTNPKGTQQFWHYYVFLFLAIISALLLAIVSFKWMEQRHEHYWKKQNIYIGSFSGIITHSFVPTNWLSGLGLYVYQLWNNEKNSTLVNPAEKYQYSAITSMDNLRVVFVLGESTRSDHLGVLGYTRQNTPLLSRENNALAFKGLSCDTATKLSMRCMFVREGAVKNNEIRSLLEQNVFVVLRYLGFSSHVYAMQGEDWFYSSIQSESYMRREELISHFFDSSNYIDDSLLVLALKERLAKAKSAPELILLHMKGSHFSYTQRYPRHFAQYKPECSGLDNQCDEQSLINAYDNSIRYVDYNLHQIFNALRNENAIVFFVSDHGESINNGVHFHATPREIAPPEQFQVPFIIWASDKFLANQVHKKRFEQLKLAYKRNRILRHEEIYDSLLSCIGFKSKDGGINRKNDWCS